MEETGRMEGWLRARELVESIESLEPRQAWARVSEIRRELGLDRSNGPLPLFVGLAVRLELAHALYAEIAGRHLLAMESYDRLVRWYDRIGVVSEAHVDGLISAYGWAVLNEQPEWVQRLDARLDAAVEALEGDELTSRIMRDTIEAWRARAGVLLADASPEPVPPVLDYRRFAEAQENYALDLEVMSELESETRSTLSEAANRDESQPQALETLEWLALTLGFMESFHAVRDAIAGRLEDPHALTLHFADAFLTARRQLPS